MKKMFGQKGIKWKTNHGKKMKSSQWVPKMGKEKGNPGRRNVKDP